MGPYHDGHFRRTMKNYAYEANERYQQSFLTVLSKGAKAQKLDNAQITLSKEDAARVHFPHSDALVVKSTIRNHTICMMLVDNGSSVHILYSDYFNKMGIDKS